jgi:WD40 repeat protein/uncharacterized caspase-like protein
MFLKNKKIRTVGPVLFLTCFFLNGFMAQETPQLVLPINHTQQVVGCDFSTDDRYVVTGSEDNTVNIYETTTGKEVRSFSHHIKKVNTVFFDKSNQTIYTASEDGTCLLIDFNSGAIIKQIDAPNKEGIQFAHLDPTENFLLVQLNLGVLVYNLKTNLWVTDKPLKGKISDDKNHVFTKEGDRAVLVQRDHSIGLIDFKTGVATKSIDAQEDVLTWGFDYSRQKLIMGCSDHTLRVFDTQTWELVHTTQAFKGVPISLSFHSSAPRVLVSIDDYSIQELHTETGKQLHSWRLSKERNTVGLYVENNSIALIDWEQRLSFVDDSSYQDLFEIDLKNDPAEIYNSSTSGKYVFLSCENEYKLLDLVSKKWAFNKEFSTHSWLAAFQGDQNDWITGASGFFRQIDGTTGRIKQQFKDSDRSYLAVNYSNEKNQFLVGGTDGVVKILDGTDLHLVRSFPSLSYTITKVKWLDTNRFLVTGYLGKIILYDLSLDRIVQTFPCDFYRGAVYDFSLSPNGKVLLACGFNKSILAFSMETGERLDQHTLSNDFIYSTSFNSSGNEVLTASRNGKWTLWSYPEFKKIREINMSTVRNSLFSHYGDSSFLTGNFSSDEIFARFSPDEKTVLVTSSDGNIYLFEAETGTLNKVLKGHKAMVTNAQFSSDGKYILSCGKDTRFILWSAESGKALFHRIQLKNGEWLVYDEHYRFDGSPDAREQLYFTCGLEIIDLNQLKDSLFVPNLVQRIMNGEDLSHLPKLSNLTICGVTPIVRAEPTEKNEFTYLIESGSGGIGQIDVYINGVKRQSVDPENIKKKGRYLLAVDPKLVSKYRLPGEPLKVRVVAHTRDRSMTSRGVQVDELATASGTFRKPSLHALVIGIDDYKGNELDLQFASRDANDLQTLVQQAAMKFLNTDDTNRVFFYNGTVNPKGETGNSIQKGFTPDRTAILNALKNIREQSKPEDILLIFFAGHGELEGDQLVLLTAESSIESRKGIGMNELMGILSEIPAGKRLLILDACHSGAAINNLQLAQYTGKRDTKEAERESKRLKALDKLAAQSGLAVITASNSSQKAMELPQYEHGLLTYALLDAVINHPEVLDQDQLLRIEKWLMIAQESVSKLNPDQSAERFTPLDFPIGSVDQVVRSSISLKQKPLVIVKNVLNRSSDDDDLAVEVILLDKLNKAASRGQQLTLQADNLIPEHAYLLTLTYTHEKGELNMRLTLKQQGRTVFQQEKKGLILEKELIIDQLLEEMQRNLNGK